MGDGSVALNDSLRQGATDIQQRSRAQVALGAAFWLWGLAAALSVPVFLITLTIQGLVGAQALYDYGFRKYDIAREVGISQQDLERVVAPAFIHYFRSNQESLQIHVLAKGQERDLFTEREIVHMRDVKGLVRLDGRLMWASFAIGAGYLLAGVLLVRRGFGLRLARRAMAGGALTIVLLAALGIGLLVGFDSLFVQFHLISFSNDFWLLDPAQNYLVAMFTEGFFQDAALLFATLVLVEAGMLTALAAGYLRWQRGRQ